MSMLGYLALRYTLSCHFSNYIQYPGATGICLRRKLHSHSFSGGCLSQTGIRAFAVLLVVHHAGFILYFSIPSYFSVLDTNESFNGIAGGLRSPYLEGMRKPLRPKAGCRACGVGSTALYGLSVGHRPSIRSYSTLVTICWEKCRTGDTAPKVIVT
jgi:hypothetical protein